MTLSLLDQSPEPEPAPGALLAAGALAAPAGWPAPPDPAAYHELLGQIVTTIAPAHRG